MASTTSPPTNLPASSTVPASTSTYDDTHLWTTTQESGLLQALVRWKPVGMHKHFRMIAIHEHLLSTGLISPEDPHTSTAGIWRKLGTLYDLERLDEREDSIIFDGSGDGRDERGESEARSVSGGSKEPDQYWREFELPRDEFEELMWQRRLAPDGGALSSSRTQSPATVTGTARRESTIADTDEPRSSPNEIETGSGKGSRRTSKATSVAEQEDEVMEDVDDGGDEEEDDEEESEEQDDEEENDTKRGTGSKRARGGRRGRGRRGRRR